MKCDICYTMIPIGKKRCPNCGYIIKKTTGIKSTTLEFDHIEEPENMPTFDHIKDRIKMPSFDHIEVQKPKQKKQQDNIEFSAVKSTVLSLIMLIVFYIFMMIMLSQ